MQKYQGELQFSLLGSRMSNFDFPEITGNNWVSRFLLITLKIAAVGLVGAVTVKLQRRVGVLQ